MHVVFPQLLAFSDVALLCLRLLVAAVFFTSGLRHARDPVGRAASIGLSPGITRVLGFLGRQSVRLALRPAAPRLQPRDLDDWRRTLRPRLILSAEVTPHQQEGA